MVPKEKFHQTHLDMEVLYSHLDGISNVKNPFIDFWLASVTSIDPIKHQFAKNVSFEYPVFEVIVNKKIQKWSQYDTNEVLHKFKTLLNKGSRKNPKDILQVLPIRRDVEDAHIYEDKFTENNIPMEGDRYIHFYTSKLRKLMLNKGTSFLHQLSFHLSPSWHMYFVAHKNIS